MIGFKGNGEEALIAIDDMKFNLCEYPKPLSNECDSMDDKFQCSSGHCVDNSLTCDLNDDCCDGSDEIIDTCIFYYKFVF